VLGTRVDVHGVATELPPSVVHVQPAGAWTSPPTCETYPSGWRVSLSDPSLALVVQPRLRDQELYFPGENTNSMSPLAYWEGDVAVLSESSSEPLGVGYVELTGYAR
jgi:predicted secreted hydrolase